MHIHIRTILSAALLTALAACGGSSQSPDDNAAAIADAPQALRTKMGGASSGTGTLTAAEIVSGTGMTTTATETAVTPSAASQFLAQATFGPSDGAIEEVVTVGYATWFDRQFRKPQALHRMQMEAWLATKPAGTRLITTDFYNSFWKQVITGPDQLRQRMQYALSQIFVVSFDGSISGLPRGGASYYDMLGQNAFGNFRQILDGVAHHPMMGIYLSFLRNQKESDTRAPDQNFAREIMQLMTIGLYQLNQDGTQKLANGKPIETYTSEDVAGLAKVFTGWSWAGPDTSTARFLGGVPDPDRDWKPMQNYQWVHSTSEKRFLGKTISGATTGEADMKVALDTLFNHPNVGPFIGRRLIQHFVSSNPTPAYISRVAAAFNNNGNGVRGDMKAVIMAVLLDPEARASTFEGREKMREPVIRTANWMRAFKVKSPSGMYLVGNTDDPLQSLGYTPFRSPSVFNFYRPDYVPPGTAVSSASKVAPEMQLLTDPEVIGYLNFIQVAIQYGMGGGRELQADYVAELSLVNQPEKLADRINLLVLNGTMSSGLRNQIITAINATPIPYTTATSPELISEARLNRVYIAIYLAMISPEYVIQH
ncbi:DUF1800 domain-containing protein [Duganella sp. PWIR1]